MRDRTYHVVIRVFDALFRVLGLRFDVRGEEHIPRSGPAVIAANHIGFLDFAFVGVAARDRQRLIRFMAKSEAFGTPGVRQLMRAMRHIPVDRRQGAGAYLRATVELRRGELVGVFPEATISRAWILKPFKLGAAALAVRERVPLVPVIAWGGHRVFTVDGHLGLRRGKAITICVGEPIPIEPDADFEAVNRLLNDRMAELLDRVQRAYPDQPRSAADRWWAPRHLGGTAPTPTEAARLDTEGVARAMAREAKKALEAKASPLGKP